MIIALIQLIMTSLLISTQIPAAVFNHCLFSEASLCFDNELHQLISDLDCKFRLDSSVDTTQ